MKLLLAEDEVDLSAAIKQILEIGGYAVDAVFNGDDALYYAENGSYDGVILDVMMPGLDGITVVKEMREHGYGVPVLILTARAEIDDKVLGLDSGADDYLTKPFAAKELLARVRALTRRKAETLSAVTFGGVTLDPGTCELRAADGSARLTNKEYRLMEYLIRNHNAVLSTERIFGQVWDSEAEAELSVVWVFISALRKKLKNIGAGCEIVAARGVGYRLEEKK